MITIDTFDIRSKWSLEPLYENFNNALMKYPSIKDRVTEDFEDEDGVSVLNSTAKIASQEVVLSFICDSYAKYLEFMEYLVAHQNVTLHSDYTGRSYILEYMSCSGFSDYEYFNTFSAKFREPNPKSRV